MKLMEFFNQARELGADRNDPLLSIVKNLKEERMHLVELRRRSQGFLIPITTKGKTVMAADPDLSEDVADLAKEIETSKARIAELEDRITLVDDICAKYSIQRPLLRELRYELGSAKKSITRSKEKVGGTLGHVLSYENHDETEAKQHPKYLEAVREYESRKQKLEPKIQMLETALADLSVVI